MEVKELWGCRKEQLPSSVGAEEPPLGQTFMDWEEKGGDIRFGPSSPEGNPDTHSHCPFATGHRPRHTCSHTTPYRRQWDEVWMGLFPGSSLCISRTMATTQGHSRFCTQPTRTHSAQAWPWVDTEGAKRNEPRLCPGRPQPAREEGMGHRGQEHSPQTPSAPQGREGWL